jgi:hypothetical protein
VLCSLCLPTCVHTASCASLHFLCTLGSATGDLQLANRPSHATLLSAAGALVPLILCTRHQNSAFAFPVHIMIWSPGPVTYTLASSSHFSEQSYHRCLTGDCCACAADCVTRLTSLAADCSAQIQSITVSLTAPHNVTTSTRKNFRNVKRHQPFLHV